MNLEREPGAAQRTSALEQAWPGLTSSDLGPQLVASALALRTGADSFVQKPRRSQ